MIELFLSMGTVSIYVNKKAWFVLVIFNDYIWPVYLKCAIVKSESIVMFAPATTGGVLFSYHLVACYVLYCFQIVHYRYFPTLSSLVFIHLV